MSDISIYVDGSFSESVYGYSFIAIPDGESPKVYMGAGNSPEVLSLRNISAEMIAAMCAVVYAIKSGYQTLTIFYDYEGIKYWAVGGWKTKNTLTAQYAKFMREKSREINLIFNKVKSHTGVKYNELADCFAKQAICEFLE